MTAVWDDGWTTGREHDVATVAHATGSLPSEVRNMHPQTLRDMVDSVEGKVRRGRSPEQIARDQALEDLRMADMLDAENSNPARFHGQLCPCWTRSKRGRIRVSLDECNCWRKGQLLTTVAIFREAGWRWVG